MAPIFRRLLATLAVFSIVLVLAATAAWWSIHTSWFAGLVRIQLLSSLEKASGGRVELREFSFNADTLHAKVFGLVVHGTEAAAAPPLLSIESAEVAVKLLSLWSHEVDLQSFVLNRPQIHLLVNPDGTTNLPTPARIRNSRDPIEQLLDLKIKHLEVSNGVFQFNNRTKPFAFTSEGVGLLLNYNHDGPSYGISLQSASANLAAWNIPFKPMRIAAKGRLYRDYADIEDFNLTTDKASSIIQFSAKIRHFSRPQADANIQANLSIDELAQLGGINSQLRNGRGHASGTAHLDIQSGKFTFEGKASATGVDFVSLPFTLRNMNGTSDMVASNSGILLHNGVASARGAHFAGEGSIKNYDFLQVQGNVSQVALREVGTFLTKQAFPWSGTAHGIAHASAHLMAKNPDFIIGAKVEVSPGETGIPTKGTVEVTYFNRTGNVEFGDSTLQLPKSSVSFKGTLNTELAVSVDSADLSDLQPIIPILGLRVGNADLPDLTSGGNAHFAGSLRGLIHEPIITGDIALTSFKFRSYSWDSLSGRVSVSSSALSIPQFQLHDAGVNLGGSASAQLANWSFGNNSPLSLNARFSNLNVAKTAALFTSSALPFIQGVASGQINLHGSLNDPHGGAALEIENLEAYGEQLNQIELDAALNGTELQFKKGQVKSGPALVKFSGVYQHALSDWSTGDVNLKVDSNGFPLAGLSLARKFVPALNALVEVHLDLMGRLRSSSFEPLRINGAAQFERVSVNSRDVGNALVNAVTRGQSIDFHYSGDLSDTKFRGTAHAQLAAGTPIQGDLQLDRIGLATARALLSGTKLTIPLDGYLDGSIAFDGLLEEPAGMHFRANIKDLQLSSISRTLAIAGPPGPDIILHNNDAIVFDIVRGVLTFSTFELNGRDTNIKVSGSAPLVGGKPVNLHATGKTDLALFSLFDPNVQSSGSSELDANIAGPITAMNINGTLQVRNGSFFLPDIPNGLSDVNGTVLFSRNRATIQKVTAHSGGGDISLGGSLSFGDGNPLVYHLEAVARNVRVRYANSISITANSDLRLSGTSASSVLSGVLTVTRVVSTPNADVGNLLAAVSSAGSASADQHDFISGLQLDVSVESAPSLQVSTNLSRDVEAGIQLRVRGTPDHPIVLGSITANQGDIKIFGTRFSLNRGEVGFVNTVRIEPVLDLDLETQAHGVTVDITVSGTPSKLNFNYRSDPPLQPSDIIALLTVGRTPGLGTTSNAQGTGDVGALSSGVNSVLGQAISPVSNRLSKLFGITNIKIDPFVQGITNTPQARLSVEQQISREVTVTYITNLSQTSEQIFRFEWALSRQFSVVAIRDDNGEFGIDFQFKKRFK